MIVQTTTLKPNRRMASESMERARNTARILSLPDPARFIKATSVTDGGEIIKINKQHWEIEETSAL